MHRNLYAKISVGVVLLLAGIGAFFVIGLFSALEEIAPAAYETGTDSLPTLSAQSWIVFDVGDGEVLYAFNERAVLPIASVTKLMSAARFREENDMSLEATVEWGDTEAEGRAGKLAAGQTYTHHELLFPLLLESSNDAAEVLLRTDPTLVDRMNDFSMLPEIQHTSFADPSGLSPKNISTAYETMVWVRHLYDTQPHIFDITVLPAYYAKENGWINNSPYIEDTAYRGGKHGFTYEANRTAVAFFEEPITGGTFRLLGYVILGSDDLKSDMDMLRSYVRTHTSYR